MKTISTVLLLAVCAVAYGQRNNFRFTRIGMSPTVTKTRTESLVALQFGLTYPETDSIPYAIIYRVLIVDDSKEYYDTYAKQYAGYYNAKGRRVDIRFSINGKNKDFTFKEFRKILWP